MSLNLLLGYTGQLSLRHVAFFGIGAYASALTTLGFDIELFGLHVVHQPWPAIVGLFVGMVVAGISGYVIGRLSFKVRGAYFVIVTISFAEVTRLVALNWVELTQGPLALTNIPPYTLGFPGLGEYTLWNKTAYYYLVAAVGLVAYLVIGRLVGSPAVQWILYGGLMIAIVFVLPQGIVPAIERWLANWRGSARQPASAMVGGNSKSRDGQ